MDNKEVNRMYVNILFPNAHNIFQSTRLYLAITDQQKLGGSALALAMRLRRSGVVVEIDSTHQSLKSQFRRAYKGEFTHVAVFGANEMETGMLTVRRVADGKEFTGSTTDLSDILAMLAAKYDQE